jgi:hypothetical protein
VKQKAATKSRPAKLYEIQNHIDALNNTAEPSESNAPVPLPVVPSDDTGEYNPDDVSGHDES